MSEPELRWERDRIEVTSNLPRPDKNWRYTDRAGHEHYWMDGYPTLVTVVDETWWCDDCRDEHTDSHLECPRCHEVIEPAMLGPSPFREFIPGRTSYYLGDEPISQERYEQIRAERRGAGP